MSRYDELLEMISAATNECVVWPYGKDSKGYGAVRVGSKMRYAHRAALELTKPAPVGKVCSVKGEWVPGHKLDAAHGPCHDPLCCNPRHLAWATRAENMADKKRDGTGQDNEKNGGCKIPNVDVDRIRSLYKGKGNGPSQYELAKEFGCHQTHISSIVNGKSRVAQ